MLDKKSLVKLALKGRKTKGPAMGANPFPGSTNEPKKGAVEKGTGAKPRSGGAVFWKQQKR